MLFMVIMNSKKYVHLLHQFDYMFVEEKNIFPTLKEPFVHSRSDAGAVQSHYHINIFPQVMINANIEDKIHWLNHFTPKDYISPSISPAGMTVGAPKVDFKHFWLQALEIAKTTI